MRGAVADFMSDVMRLACAIIDSGDVLCPDCCVVWDAFIDVIEVVALLVWDVCRLLTLE